MRYSVNQGRMRLAHAAFPILLTLLIAAPLWAVEDAAELAKKTQNPVADIITNEPTTFAIDLKTVGAEVRYDLVYQYWGGGDSGMGFRGGGGGTQRQQNMARNVCAGLAP